MRSWRAALKLDPGSAAYARGLAGSERAAKAAAKRGDAQASSGPDAKARGDAAAARAYDKAETPGPAAPGLKQAAQAARAAPAQAAGAATTDAPREAAPPPDSTPVPDADIAAGGVRAAAEALQAAVAAALQRAAVAEAAAAANTRAADAARRALIATRWRAGAAAARMAARLAAARCELRDATARAAAATAEAARLEAGVASLRRTRMDDTAAEPLSSPPLRAATPPPAPEPPAAPPSAGSVASCDDADDDSDAEAWATRWEEEQFAAHAEAAARARLTPATSRPRSTAPALTAESLRARLQPAAPATVDASGCARGSCGICGDARCGGFEPFAPGSALRPDLPALVQLEMLAAAPREHCARCGCLAARHETPAATEARRLKAAEAARRAAAAEAEERKRRARRTDAALARAKAAAASIASGGYEELIRSRTDTITGAVRGACGGCKRCGFFEVWYTSACATDADVMLFCSKCGCGAAEHVICPRWQAAHDAAERRAQAAAAAQAQARARAAAALQAPNREAARRKHLAALGAPPGADRAAAGAAYRRACLRWHPDKQAGRTPEEAEEAQRSFCAAADAWRALQEDDTWQ